MTNIFVYTAAKYNTLTPSSLHQKRNISLPMFVIISYVHAFDFFVVFMNFTHDDVHT